MKNVIKKIFAAILTGTIFAAIMPVSMAANTITINKVRVLEEGKEIEAYTTDFTNISLTPAQMLEVTASLNFDSDEDIIRKELSLLSYSTAAETKSDTTVQYMDQRTVNSGEQTVFSFRPRAGVGTGEFIAKAGAVGAESVSFTYTVLSDDKPMTLTAKNNSLAANSNEDVTFVIAPTDFTDNDYSGFNVYLDETKLTENYTITSENGEILLTIKKAALSSTPSSLAVKVTHDGYTDATGTISITTAVYTITFKNYDDTVLETVKTEDGQMPTCSITPTRAEDAQNTYAFSGWQPELAVATADASYTAQYTATPKTYSVTLNVKDGIIADGANITSYTCGTAVTLPTPTKTGYTFGGWYEDAEYAGEQVTEILATEAGDKTYYAKWTAETYTVSYNKNDGTIENESNYTSYIYGNGLTLPIPTKGDYHFGGWYDNEDCTGVSVSIISKTATGNKTYWAKWLENAPDAYLITFMNGDEVLQSSEVAVGETPSYSGATPTKEQDDRYTYTFSDWDPEIEAVTKAATYEAQFTQTPRIYTVTLDADGGIIDGDVTTYTYGTGVTLPTNVTKTGYTFDGWYDSGDNRVLSISTSDTGNQSYTAKWEANTYTVTLNVNGGTLAQNLTAYTYGVGAVLPIPTRDDYSFDGWYDNEDCTGNAITEISAAETGDKTYYAKWTKNINKKIVAVLDNFADKLTIEKIVDNGTVTLAIAPKENTVLPRLALYCAIYTEGGILKTINKISCSTAEQNAAVSFTEPQVEAGESYKLMLWSEIQEPVIPVITNATIGFFE